MKFFLADLRKYSIYDLWTKKKNGLNWVKTGNLDHILNLKYTCAAGLCHLVFYNFVLLDLDVSPLKSNWYEIRNIVLLCLWQLAIEFRPRFLCSDCESSGVVVLCKGYMIYLYATFLIFRRQQGNKYCNDLLLKRNVTAKLVGVNN